MKNYLKNNHKIASKIAAVIGKIFDKSSLAISSASLNNILTPAGSKLNSEWAEIFSHQLDNSDQSTGLSLESSQISHSNSFDCGGWVADAPANSGHATPMLDSLGSKSQVA